MSCLECLRYGLSNGVNDSVIEVNFSKPPLPPFCFKIFPPQKNLGEAPSVAKALADNGVGAFPQFLSQEEDKTEKFSFP